MCSNYETVTRADRLLSFFGVVREGDEKPLIAFPLNTAPFIRLAEEWTHVARMWRRITRSKLQSSVVSPKVG